MPFECRVYNSSLNKRVLEHITIFFTDLKIIKIDRATTAACIRIYAYIALKKEITFTSASDEELKRSKGVGKYITHDVESTSTLGSERHAEETVMAMQIFTHRQVCHLRNLSNANEVTIQGIHCKFSRLSLSGVFIV